MSAVTATRIDVIQFSMEHTPGALAKIYRALKDAGISVRASWGWAEGPSAGAQIHVVDTAKAKAIVEKHATNVKVRQGAWIEGADDVGAYLQILDKLAAAGVNIDASDAYAVGSRFAGGVFFADQDVAAGMKALGI